MDIKILKNEIEEWLNTYFINKPESEKKHYDAMVYSLNVGGKRIRPILMILTYAMYKKNYKDILPFAASMEMIHTYSLIHDDLPCMDDDDLRRGKPTNHKIYGEAIAVLAGDGLLNEAMIIILEQCMSAELNKIRAGNIIAKSAGNSGMIAGQMVDILSEGKTISEEQLLYMHKKKTGELIKAAIISGAILGEASDKDLEYLDTFGEKLGVAFQIKDDILDIIGNKELLGKNVKSDECNNKTTFVTTYGLEECKQMCVNLTNECFKLLKNINKNTEYLQNLTEFLLKREF